MMNFVIPESLKILSSKLKVNSNQIIPAFDPGWNYCDDQGKLTITDSYKTNTTDGDFLLFLGVVNKPNEGYLAYATFCFVGESYISNLLFEIFF